VYYPHEYVLAGHRFETTRKGRWIADSLLHAPLAGFELTAPAPLAEAEVSAVHDPVYVAAVRTGRPRPLAESQGFRWDAGLWPMVLASNGGVVAAALASLASRRSGIAGSLSSGLHHARHARGNGYCTFNGLALAARAVLAAGAHNVLILDLDAHCGGGTHELLGTDPSVWIGDVAVHAFDHYTPSRHNTLDIVPSTER
jgi:acetoin utilization deacetylase AcuC-like enzyme